VRGDYVGPDLTDIQFVQPRGAVVRLPSDDQEVATILPSAMANARQANLGLMPVHHCLPLRFPAQLLLNQHRINLFESVVIK
jgi:hypothetical protein